MTVKAPYLDALLQVLHDRGVVNEDELQRVCADLVDGHPRSLTRDDLIAIFGVVPIYRLLTVRDETAWQFVREAFDLLTNPESPCDLRDWIKAVESCGAGPIATIRRHDPQDAA
jgi:hypothetical protein